MHETSPVTHGCTSLRGSATEWGPDEEFPIKRIINHKRTSKQLEYLVEWEGKDSDGKPWPDWWVPASWVDDASIAAYDRKLLGIETKMVTVDVSPLVYLARKSVAHAVMLAKTKMRPRLHRLQLDALTLQPLAEAVLQMLTRPARLSVASMASRRTLPITITKDADGTINHSLVYKEMDDVATFCAFEHFVSTESAAGALRFNLGRASNVDLMVVGVPMIFNMSTNRAVPGTVTFTITFATVHVNGLYGTPTFPHMKKGLLTKQQIRAKLVRYCMDTIPDAHPLVAKGWRNLPEGTFTLPKEVAVPDGSSAA